MRRLATLALILGGCTGGADGPSTASDAGADVVADASPVLDEPEVPAEPPVDEPAGCPDALPAIEPDAPIFVYYGAYRPRWDLDPRVDSNQTMTLVTAPGEVVLTLRRPDRSCVSDDPEYGPWIEAGGQLAHVMSLEELENAMDDDRGADAVEAWLRRGYAYVAVDEIGASDASWHDDGGHARKFERLVQDLADRDLDRRLVIYVNSYNMPGQFGSFADVLTACRDHCRVLASEVYLATTNVLASAAGETLIESEGRCNRRLSCLQSLAREIDEAAPGIRRRTITILGIADAYSQGLESSLCDRPEGGHGALYIQYARLHSRDATSDQPGIGGYALGHVLRSEHPSWGPADQAACLARLNGWDHWPDAR